MASCFSSIDEDDCVGVYIHKHSMDGSFLHYCNDTSSNKYKYMGFWCEFMHNKGANTYMDKWSFLPDYPQPLSIDHTHVNVCSTGMYLNPDVNDYFERIDTIEAIELGILPEECSRDLKLEPLQIIPEVQDYLQRLPDETYKAVYHKYSNYKARTEREQIINRLFH